MNTKNWNIADSAHRTQVFSGGACNILTREGTLIRNSERDRINDWLTEQGIFFFDPQIHPETHGVEYDYDVHHRLEMAAREAATINLYEVSPRTFGGITSFEIATDHFQREEPMVIFFSDGNSDADEIPAHSKEGHPLFAPDGIKDSLTACRAHYREFVKNAHNMRRYVADFAREMDTLTVTFGEQIHANDIVITPDRMHAADLFRAVVKAHSGERVFVTFTGGPAARDDAGNPLFLAPPDPPDIELNMLLDQYVDEGNELRHAIAELVNISVFVRVVYTQQSTILALEEVLRIRGLID